MRNRLRDEMHYSCGSSEGRSLGGQAYGYLRKTGMHAGIATEARIAELAARAERGEPLFETTIGGPATVTETTRGPRTARPVL